MDWIKDLWRSFIKNPWQPRYAVPLVLINAAGSVYGYYWYAGQLSATALKWWPFVPDSPLSTTMFALVLLLSLLGVQNALLGLLAFTGCVKYGLWAVILISEFWAGGGPVRFTEAMLWASHLGMAAQGAIYLGSYLSPGAGSRGFGGPVLAAAAVWMLLNDFLDYYFGIHPYLYHPGQLLLGAASALGLSVLLILSLKILSWLKMAGNSRN